MRNPRALELVCAVSYVVILSVCFQDFFFVFSFHKFSYDVFIVWSLFGVYLAFLLCRFMSFAKFGKFSAIISLKIFFIEV